MKIYTRNGDKMKTTTFKGQVYKSDLVIEVEGTLDEATTVLAFARANNTDKDIKDILEKLINKMFVFGSEFLGYTSNKLTSNDTLELENIIDKYSEKMEKSNDFIVPGQNVRSASIHLARTTIRRLERRVVAYYREYEDERNDTLLMFINRISDLLFILGKWEDLHQ